MTKREERLRALKEFDADHYSTVVRSIAGMDEVGRGPLIGCVLAACVILPPASSLLWVDDSKRLSETRREEAFERIKSEALFIGIGEASPEEIDQLNILNATRLAMERAAHSCPADLLLVDAVTGLHLPCPSKSVVHGDATSYAIAAASIVAKVLRDRQMIQLDSKYPGYGLKSNKGYGTKEHMKALRALGPTPMHRKTFLRNIL